jgi:glycerol uptake facilitator-like aquaporin
VSAGQREGWADGAVAGLPIGLALVAVHIFGIAVDGTSVNPARSLGPSDPAPGDNVASPRSVPSGTHPD